MKYILGAATVFAGLGLGFIGYFGLGLMSLVDSALLAAGLLMVMDGALWYLPVRNEQAGVQRCPVRA